MLYCAKCRGFCEDGRRKCPSCGSTKLRELKDDDYVLLQRVDLYTSQQLAAQFEDFSMDYLVEEFGKGRVSYLYDSEVLPTDKNVYVRYRDLPTARGISQKLEEDAAQEEILAEETSFEDMSQRKRIIVQIVSVVAFLLLITLVVFGADSVANWIRGFFF